VRPLTTSPHSRIPRAFESQLRIHVRSGNRPHFNFGARRLPACISWTSTIWTSRSRPARCIRPGRQTPTDPSDRSDPAAGCSRPNPTADSRDPDERDESAWPDYCVRATSAGMAKPARSCAKCSPCPVTCRSSAAPCTSGSIPPAPPDAPKPSPQYASNSPTLQPALPRHRPGPRLQRQGPPRQCVNDLTRSGVLDRAAGWHPTLREHPEYKHTEPRP